jgi:hypothetical protein
MGHMALFKAVQSRKFFFFVNIFVFHIFFDQILPDLIATEGGMLGSYGHCQAPNALPYPFGHKTMPIAFVTLF